MWRIEECRHAGLTEVATNPGIDDTARIQPFDRCQHALDAVIERVVMGGREQVEAHRDQIIDYPAVSSQMIPAALLNGIANEVVRYRLKVCEGHIGGLNPLPQAGCLFVSGTGHAAGDKAVPG